MSRSPYAILGLEPGASSAAIRAAYRTRAKSLHPDVGGDAEAFLELRVAYRILTEPELHTRWQKVGDDLVDAQRAAERRRAQLTRRRGRLRRLHEL